MAEGPFLVDDGRRHRTLTDYAGNYSDYLVESQARLERLRQAKKEQDEEVARVKLFIDRFRYKATKAAQVQSRLKMLEKVRPIEVPPERKRVHFKFPECVKSGRGEVVQRWDVPPDQQRGAWFERRLQRELKESSWIAARVWSTTPGGQPDAEAHTNPVYVYLRGRAPYRQASLDAWVARIDEQIAKHTQRQFKEKAQVLAYFQRARDQLLKVRGQGGLQAEEALKIVGTFSNQDSVRPTEPASSTKEMSATDLVADPARRDATDAQLKEFLKPVPPTPPERVEGTFECSAGFHMELVAAEPLVYDPVAHWVWGDGGFH